MSNAPLDPVRLARVRELATIWAAAFDAVVRFLEHDDEAEAPVRVGWHTEQGAQLIALRRAEKVAKEAYLAECDPAFLLSLIEAAEDTRRLNEMERVINADGGIQLRVWDHDGRRWVPKDRDGSGLLLVHKFAARGGVDESLRDALDKLPAVYDFAPSPASEA